MVFLFDKSDLLSYNYPLVLALHYAGVVFHGILCDMQKIVKKKY